MMRLCEYDVHTPDNRRAVCSSLNDTSSEFYVWCDDVYMVRRRIDENAA